MSLGCSQEGVHVHVSGSAFSERLSADLSQAPFIQVLAAWL